MLLGEKTTDKPSDSDVDISHCMGRISRQKTSTGRSAEPKTTHTSQESFGCTRRSSTFRKSCILHLLNLKYSHFCQKDEICLHSFPKNGQNFQKTLGKVRSQWGRAPQFGRVTQAGSEGPDRHIAKSWNIPTAQVFHGNQRMGFYFPSKWTQTLLKTSDTSQVQSRNTKQPQVCAVELSESLSSICVPCVASLNYFRNIRL